MSENCESSPYLSGLTGSKSLVRAMQIQTQDDITAVEATPAAPATPEPTASPETVANDDEAQPLEPEKKPDGVQKRINELTAKARAAERRAEILERELEARQRQPEPAKQDAADREPSLDDGFDTYDDYIKALNKWQFKQEFAARDQAAQAERSKISAAEEQKSFRGRVEKQVDLGRGEFEDFDEVVIGNPDLPVSASMAQALVEMDDGHKVAYYLGKNPEEAADIASMSPTRQAIALGRIEAKLASKPPAKTVSTAPAPVGSQLNGGASPSKADPSKMTDAEWAKWDAEQANKSRR